VLEANEMISAGGVRINLIFNGARIARSHHVLRHSPVRLLGMTHPAFVVDDLQALERRLGEQAADITDRPNVPETEWNLLPPMPTPGRLPDRSR
jgi:lactoylglutathione lyase